MVNKKGPETSYKDRAQVVYSRQTRERQIFMQDLRKLRKRKEKHLLKTMQNLIGPTWLQALSVPQRNALDTLEFSIHQDLLEGFPIRTAVIMRQLGLYPRPNNEDLMICVYFGRNDPKEMLAHLFLMSYDHPIEAKRSSYSLNARLMLSSILYLGLDNLLELLKIKFHPDVKDKPEKSKPKQKPPPLLKSPYLQDMIAVLYLPSKPKPFTPLPLPNLDDLDEPYEEEPPVSKPPPPPPPPPPLKKSLPRAYCDKLAGILSIHPKTPVSAMVLKTITHKRHLHTPKGSKMCVEVKKTYGISTTRSGKGNRRKKMVSPSTGIWNAQYMINGVFKIQGKTVFVLGTVSILPPNGDLINGGYRLIEGEYINIHCGFRGRPPPPKQDPCDCLKKWQESAFKYAKETKCKCGHHYDYGNEGTFLPEEAPYFLKPTKFVPFQFNYQTIYNIDQKHIFVENEFKRIWDTESALQIGDSAAIERKDKKKKKTKKSSKTCLGYDPKPEDYLKCALRHMRPINIAAKLPDIHLVPELREWMRWRIYGPYSRSEKQELFRKCNSFCQQFLTLTLKGYGHVEPKKDKRYDGHTNWIHKQDLNDKFRKFAQKYKLELFRSYAHVTNMFWSTMYQAEFPDKKFREIYFSYLFGRIEDLQLMHPYSSREALERKYIISKKRYCCVPEGIEANE